MKKTINGKTFDMENVAYVDSSNMPYKKLILPRPFSKLLKKETIFCTLTHSIAPNGMVNL